MDNLAVRIEKAVVSYREDVALRGVSLEVRRGELVGIIGPNGAGKTTLLTLINGLGKLLAGRVWVLGQWLDSSNVSGLRKRIGYVPQMQNIDSRLPLRVREVVMIGRYGRLGLFRRPGREDWSMVDSLLDLVGMSHLAGRPIGHLSGGEQQRTVIARALAQQPEILLLDEPTASLDLRAQAEILELIREIHSRHQLTTFFVTHDLDSLPKACDRVVLMKAGKIWREGKMELTLNEQVLSELYDTPISLGGRIA